MVSRFSETQNLERKLPLPNGVDGPHSEIQIPFVVSARTNIQAMASIDSLVQTWMASGRDEEIIETVSGTLNTYGSWSMKH